MKIGGGGREQWLVIVPMAALAIAVTIWFGGPTNTMSVFEHMAYDAWETVRVMLRR